MKAIPALITAFLFAIGICIERYALLQPVYVLPILIAILMAILFIKNPVIRQANFLLILLLAGMCHASISYFLFPSNHITRFLDQENKITVYGFLAKDPVVREDRVDWTLSLDSLQTGTFRTCTCGEVSVTFYRNLPPELEYGDYIRLTGTLVSPSRQRNPGGFDYRTYLARNGIWGIFKPSPGTLEIFASSKRGTWINRHCIYPLRRSLLKIIEQTTAPRHQAFVKALTLGDRSELSPEIKETFARSGLIHLLAVSGLHVGFILAGVQIFLGFFRFPRKWSICLTIIILVIYALLTEMKPPVTRAVIMASVFLVGQLLGRKTSPFNSLGTAALILLIINPDRLFDPGFQMSFSAVFSILYCYPKISQIVFLQKLMHHRFFLIRYSIQLLILSLSAQLGTAPISVFYFNRFSPVSLVLNIAAIPLVGIIMALCLIIWLIAPFSLWIALSFGALNNICIDLLNLIAEKPSLIPGAYVSLPTPSILFMLTYLGILVLLFEYKKTLLRRPGMIGLLLLLNIAVWKYVWTNPSNKLTWIQFDVGQGDAALLRLPGNKNILIDAGERREHFDTGERIIAPYLIKNGIRKLDAIILTHRHGDHNGGLPYILRHFKVDQFITTPSDYSTGTTRLVDSLLFNRSIPQLFVTADDTIFHDSGVLLKILSPDTLMEKPLENFSHDVNNQSIVLLGAYGSASFLAMGDAETPIEKILLENQSLPQSVDLLKAGHHGSKTSSSLELIRYVNPKNVIVSVGKNNRHGHPSKEVMENYLSHHASIYRTDQEAACVFETHGISFKTVNWKPSFPYQLP